MAYVAKYYVGIDLLGCLYHFSRSIICGNVQALGIQELYQDDSEFVMSGIMVAALAFVPLSLTVQVFEELVDFAEDDDMTK
ncbi:hypothetical protein ACJMK2_032707, partial [Sinanodonta woodiana]